MPRPTVITVNGTYLKLDGTPEVGTVTFRTNIFVLDGDSASVMVPSSISATLNGSGSFTVQLPATNDPDWTPVGWTYEVIVNLSQSSTKYHVQIPYDAPSGSLSISDLLPVAAVSGTMYAPYSHEHSGYVTSADLSGAVSSAIASSLTPYAPLASPTFTGTPAAPTAARHISTTQVGTTAHTWYVVSDKLDLLTSGEEVIPRNGVTAEAALSTGVLHLSFFTARRTETITKVLTGVSGTAFTGTLARIGIYSVNTSTGALTLVASTTNDTTLWGTTYTGYQKALSASYSKTAGTRYAVGFLAIGTSMPTVEISPIRYFSADLAPRIQGQLAGQTDLPASITNASLVTDYRRIQAILLP